MRHLHSLQEKLLKVLRGIEGAGYTYRQLMREIGASSTSQVVHHLRQLERKGLLKKDPDNPQSFLLIDEAEDEFSFLPLMALASCGIGIDNEQHVIERLPVRSALIPSKVEDSFLVQAENDSMEPRIHKGDIVLIERFIRGRHNPEGKVVVCEENNEAKIKKYSTSGKSIVLESFNSKYPSHVVENPNSFKVHGIVRGILFSKL